MDSFEIYGQHTISVHPYELDVGVCLQKLNEMISFTVISETLFWTTFLMRHKPWGWVLDGWLIAWPSLRVTGFFTKKYTGKTRELFVRIEKEQTVSFLNSTVSFFFLQLTKQSWWNTLNEGVWRGRKSLPKTTPSQRSSRRGGNLLDKRKDLPSAFYASSLLYQKVRGDLVSNSKILSWFHRNRYNFQICFVPSSMQYAEQWQTGVTTVQETDALRSHNSSFSEGDMVHLAQSGRLWLSIPYQPNLTYRNKRRTQNSKCFYKCEPPPPKLSRGLKLVSSAHRVPTCILRR